MKKTKCIPELRWMALIKAVDIISKECKKKNVNFDNIPLNTTAIQKYVDELYDHYKLVYDINIKNDIANTVQYQVIHQNNLI